MILISKLDHLQQSSDEYVIMLESYLPSFCMQSLPFISHHSNLIALISFGFHICGVNKRVTRITFPEILAFGGWLLLLPISVFFSIADTILLEFMLSCFLFPLITFNLITKRKRLHKKKPNSINSAFSVASTPASQCSSAFLSNSRLSTMNGSQINISNDNIFNESMMDTSPITERNLLNGREMTPCSELSGKLDSLSLGFGFGTNKDLVRENPSSMLTKGALTPSKMQRHDGSPFKSFGNIQKPTWPTTMASPTRNSNAFPSPPKSIFGSPNKAQSVFCPPTQPGAYGIPRKRLDFGTLASQTNRPSAFSVLSAPEYNNRLRPASISTHSSTSTRRDLAPKSNRVSLRQALIGGLAAIGGISLLKMALEIVKSYF
uniref:Uncharacterized protein n=2 Tax=Bursaphelenchus xylophilus TaxID=6326 RepID=A0A1I7SWL4_BURXY